MGPNGTRAVKRVLGRLKVDEAEIVYAAMAQRFPAGVMIDVGAHYGESLDLFAAKGWRVFAFEPDNANRQLLERGFGALPNVTVDPRAVAAERADSLAFYASEVSSGISGLSAFHETHVQSQTVSATTLAGLIDEYRIDRVDFLKIDTEGHDLFVLQGNDWDRLVPEVIVCEFEDRKTLPLGYSFLDMHDYLAQRGYSVTISEWHPVVEYGQRHKWSRFTNDPSSVGEGAWGNFIAFRDSERLAGLRVGNIDKLSAKLFGN